MAKWTVFLSGLWIGGAVATLHINTPFAPGARERLHAQLVLLKA